MSHHLDAYDFVQSSPSATWTITHNLGTTEVAMDVYLDVGSPAERTKAQPDTQVIVDSNTVKVTWSVAQSGGGRVLGGGD